MLNVYFGDMEDSIYNTSSYFKFNYEKEWLDDPEIKEMIKDVDSSVVLGTGAIDSPVMGVIAPTALSGGVKTLILIDKVPDKVFNASNCGDNCAEWLLKMGDVKDVTVNLRHIMHFERDSFNIKILHTDDIVCDMDSFIKIAGRYV